ncbi:peptidase M23-like protein [Tamaricihabitans halophyticus]|uniref:Peptidase M23-like protein n=1 Tax=Tamaricihabitans halophyticus TaxID=1262583 RepID=A0A4V2SQE9_9PSEU|nr:peptidase M23-like protein [Tamaricihabitans halophyticus]
MSLKTKLVVAAALVGVLVWAHHRSEPSMAETGHVTPVDGATFTSGYGPRWGSTHGGIDLAAPLGTPIRAVTSGTVIEAGPASGFGNWVRIQHPDNTVTVYGHMAVYHVRAGQRVTTGERIAEVGNEGQSTGPHLHLEVWPGGDRNARVDPQPWLAQRGVHL